MTSNSKIKVYTWPSKLSKDAMTHGIVENGLIYNGRVGDKYEAPTDWTIYMQYTFGPQAAKIRTSVKGDWYTEVDEVYIQEKF